MSHTSAVASMLGVLIAASTAVAQAQSEPQSKTVELRITSGALVSTGAQRNALKDAQLTGAQVSWLVRPSLAVTGTFGWARSRDLGLTTTPKLDVFTSDLGVEARGGQWLRGRAMSFNPFVGIGGGARSYNYRTLDVDASHNMAAYGAIGGELGSRRVGLRLEVRDYATGFRPLVGAGKSETRNDVVVMAALRFKKHSTSNRA